MVKKKETVGTIEAQQLTAAAPPLARKDRAGLRAPAAGSSSRGSKARPQEEVISAAKPAPEAAALNPPASGGGSFGAELAS